MSDDYILTIRKIKTIDNILNILIEQSKEVTEVKYILYQDFKVFLCLLINLNY
jgi:hypothetical protein